MTTVKVTFPNSGGYSWTCPADVTSITFEGIGGGGAGGSLSATTGRTGGGAGGAYSSTTISVTPGTTYTVAVGAGGTVVAGATGNPGGDTTFNSTSGVAKGGGGGIKGAAGAAGAGGTCPAGSTGTVNLGGAGGAGAATAANGGGGGGGGGGSTGAGTAGTSPTSSGGGPGGAGGTGVSPLVGGAGGHGSTNNSVTNLTAGTAPGGGGGGVGRTTSGTVSAAAGSAGYAAITFTTNDPYVVQAVPFAGTTATLAAVGAGNTVLCFTANTSASGVTLGGVAGTEILGAEVGSPVLQCWKWENVTGGPTAIVVSPSNVYGGIVEIGNPGTITTGEHTSATATSISLTPAAPVVGQLVIAAAWMTGVVFGTYTAVPAAPYTVQVGVQGSTQGISLVTYSAEGTTGHAASWTQSGSAALAAIGTVSINPPASRAGFMVANQ